MEWYVFYPAGTLLFKGAEPMDMGADHHASQIFPPPAKTITGALRTAVLIQNSISFEKYYKNKAPAEIINSIGNAGSEAPFEIIGPIFNKDNRFFIPAPYSWFMEKAKLNDKKVRIFKAKSTHSLLVKSDNESLYWVKGGNNEMVSIGGNWVGLEDIISEAEEKEIFSSDFFFSIEPRTGIALNRNRSVREGYLYTFSHVRLNPEVSLVFGTDKPLPVAEKGFIKLGAEQRFGRYEKIKGPSFSEKKSGSYLALSLVEGTDQSNESVIATGKIQYIGGWDLKRGFHKPMKGYFPAGSVFKTKIQPNFVQI